MTTLHRLGWTVVLLALLAPPVHALPPLQRPDGLDAPLPTTNNCGSGASGEVHFTLAATGDTFPHENIQAAAEANGYDWLFDRVRPFLQAADLAYTNFDGAMLEGSPYSGYPQFNYSPRLATALHNAGIDVVSTANNHILDRGPQGLDATIGVLEQNGIMQHGTVPSGATQSARPPYLPIVLTRDGVSIKLAFLSFSWGTNGIPDPYGQVNLLWESNSYGQQGTVRQSALDAVAQARREADLVVVAAHWGLEYESYPADWQIQGARQLAAAGADVILGAQSHTLQPVDLIEADGRTALVMYSLANFLASQGPLQAAHYSATSTIFYVGIVRERSGRVRVTGYRYLPTIHVDYDTRPAPIAPGEQPAVLDHVRAILRDPGGTRQVSPDPALLDASMPICPALRFAEQPALAIGGDFATYATMFGGKPRTTADTVAVLGYPLAPVRQELAGDCSTTTAVLLTERQRLEWQPGAPWPGRVVGSPIGTAVFRHLYPERAPKPRTDLGGTAIADPEFGMFWYSYGGLPVFGYPISGLLEETDAQTGLPSKVQYFERARFELVPGAAADAPLTERVRLGLLGREYSAIAAQCGQPAPAAVVPTVAPRASPSGAPAAARSVAVGQPAIRETGLRFESTMKNRALLAAAVVGALAIAIVFLWRRRVAVAPRPPAERRPAPAPLSSTINEHTSTRRRVYDDDELLRQLLLDES